MKYKRSILIASTMIFATVAVMALAISAMLLWKYQKIDDSSSRVEDSEAGATILIQDSETSSQGPEFVYLYDEMSHQFMRLNLQDASQEIIDLGIEVTNVGLNGVTFSDDGHYMSFCKVEIQEAANARNSLMVWDMEARQLLLEQDFSNIAACSPSAFSPDNRYIAVGMLINSPVDGINPFPDEPNWALRIFDISTNTIAYELNADSPNLPNFETMSYLGFGQGVSAMTQVLSYAQDELYFKVFPASPQNGIYGIQVYHWNLLDNSLSLIQDMSHVGSAMLPETGEMAFPVANPAFTLVELPSPIPSFNELHLSDSRGSQAVYRNTEENILNAFFVSGGRQLAISLMPAGNVRRNDYILLNRDGTVESINLEGLADPFPTSDGFLAINIEQTEQGSVQQLIRYQNGEISTIWETEASATQLWRIMWASPQIVAPNLAPFEEIN